MKLALISADGNFSFGLWGHFYWLNRVQKPIFKTCIHVKTFGKTFVLLLKIVNWFKIGSKYFVIKFLNNLAGHNHGRLVFSLFKGNIYSIGNLNNFNIVTFSNRLWNEFCKILSLNIHLTISLKDLHVTCFRIPNLPKPWLVLFLVAFKIF